MAMRNKYSKRARISEAKIREVVRYVAADLTALQAAATGQLQPHTEVDVAECHFVECLEARRA